MYRKSICEDERVKNRIKNIDLSMEKIKSISNQFDKILITPEGKKYNDMEIGIREFIYKDDTSNLDFLLDVRPEVSKEKIFIYIIPIVKSA